MFCSGCRRLAGPAHLFDEQRKVDSIFFGVSSDNLTQISHKLYINSLENDSAAQIYKRNIIANSCSQLYVCLYMILVMSFLSFQRNIRAHAP